MSIVNLIFILIFSSSVFAEDKLQYFESKIDFWGDKKIDSAKPAPIVDSSRKEDGGKFPWKTYLDPKNKEFFKEGDYTPPEPFMEVARNPTDENIKQWFELMQKKNELQTKLQARMQEYMAKNSSQNSPIESLSERPPTPVRMKTETILEPARFRIRMYFESTCPHCRKMFAVLKSLQDEGFEVEALQIDSGPVSMEEKIVPIGKAQASEIKKHGINGVPFLLIADLKRKALLPAIQGYHGLQEVKALLKEASR